MIRIQQLKLPVDYTTEDLIRTAAKRLRISPSDIKELKIRRRSIDARKKPDLYYVLTVDLRTEKDSALLKKNRDPQISLAKDIVYAYPTSGTEILYHRPVIIGCGPAGLFCGLLLARCGYRPLILERGEQIEDRTATVERFWQDGHFHSASNVQFGEGGAGTFSDGKLNTMVHDRMGRNAFVLSSFVDAGADEEILYTNKPHIGTDMLRSVVRNLRKEMESLGGEVRFQSKVTDISIKDGAVSAVTINDAETISCSVLVLAIGHSARDTFQMLLQKPIAMEQKAFAVGVRIQHPQAMIDYAQYGRSRTYSECAPREAASERGYIGEPSPSLPPADYKLTTRLQDGRGVYSFCMCPGGYVVNASSEEKRLAINGMSYHKRDSENANSAIVVTVTEADFGSRDVMAGLEFQRRLEERAWALGEGAIPVQLFEDFCNHKESLQLGDVKPCIKGAYRLSNVREIFPETLAASLEMGIRLFDRNIKGFAREDALLAGVESRTSSPVRILRGEDHMSMVKGIYPCGEGAGYAGGITSAAMDGMKVAESIIRAYRKI